jgi:PAS domain S-box-containing protein
MKRKEKTKQAFDDCPQLLQIVIDAFDGEIFVKDVDGVYQFVNSAFCKDFGVVKEEVIGKDDYFIFPPEAAARLQETDKKVMESKTSTMVEESGLFKGKFLAYRTNKVPLIDEDEEVYGICGIGFDITQQKKLE